MPQEIIRYKEFPPVEPGGKPILRKLPNPQIPKDAVPSQYPTARHLSTAPERVISGSQRAARLEKRQSLGATIRKPLQERSLNTNSLPLDKSQQNSFLNQSGPPSPPQPPAITVAAVLSWLKITPLPEAWRWEPTSEGVALLELSFSPAPVVRRSIIVHASFAYTSYVNNESRLDDLSNPTLSIATTTKTHPAITSPTDILAIISELPPASNEVISLDEMSAQADVNKVCECIPIICCTIFDV